MWGRPRGLEAHETHTRDPPGAEAADRKGCSRQDGGARVCDADAGAKARVTRRRDAKASRLRATLGAARPVKMAAGKRAMVSCPGGRGVAVAVPTGTDDWLPLRLSY